MVIDMKILGIKIVFIQKLLVGFGVSDGLSQVMWEA